MGSSEDKVMQDAGYELLRIPLLRLSEKSLRCPWSSPTGSQEVPFLADFMLCLAAKFTLGASPEHLFGESL